MKKSQEIISPACQKRSSNLPGTVRVYSIYIGDNIGDSPVPSSKNFDKLKRALLGKKNQHRLHLYSKSDLNGQYEFFRLFLIMQANREKPWCPCGITLL